MEITQLVVHMRSVKLTGSQCLINVNEIGQELDISTVDTKSLQAKINRA